MKLPVFYSRLIEATKEALEDCGVASDQANRFAEQAAFNFCQENGGEYYRVPLLKAITKQQRDSAIVRDSKTMNVKQLKKKHGVSIYVIKRALK